MSFDAPYQPGQRIAVIGAGISGLMTARFLAPANAVTLFEAAPRLGGHARTLMAGRNGDQPVDTGFIVFNYANYPHLTRMFHDLDVPVVKSDMGFAVSVDGGRVEYALDSLRGVLGQAGNVTHPSYWRMLRDIFRFNRLAQQAADSDDLTVDQLIRRLGLGPWFEHYYLRPVCGAIWSTPTTEIGAFPARTLVRFFANHALLSATGQHQWWTVEGGSIEYVTRLAADLTARGVTIRTGTPVQSVHRHAEGVTVHSPGSEPEAFDQVVFACHSDTALRLLDVPAPAERAALAAIRYQDNRAILHRDVTQMPRRRHCWAAWNHLSRTDHVQAGIGVTYWMNRLQNIAEDDPLFVTLNPMQDVPDHLVYDETVFRHPVFDGPALDAQKVLCGLQGQNRTWYAGAWLRHGFHEDGCASAARVARALTRVRV